MSVVTEQLSVTVVSHNRRSPLLCAYAVTERNTNGKSTASRTQVLLFQDSCFPNRGWRETETRRPFRQRNINKVSSNLKSARFGAGLTLLSPLYENKRVFRWRSTEETSRLCSTILAGLYMKNAGNPRKRQPDFSSIILGLGARTYAYLRRKEPFRFNPLRGNSGQITPQYTIYCSLMRK